LDGALPGARHRADLVRGLDLTRVTGTSTLLGTPAYLAPEGPEDERSDLYSLGVIAYEVLTGVVPFEGRTYQEVILRHVREAPDLEKLPAEARPIVGWLLAKDAAERPQSAHALLPVLWGQGNIPAQTQPPAPVVASTGSTWTVPPSAVPPVAGYPFGPRRSRRHRTTLVAGASVALVLTFGAAATLLVHRPGGSNPPSYSAPTPSTIASAGSPSFSPSSGSITFTLSSFMQVDNLNEIIYAYVGTPSTPTAPTAQRVHWSMPCSPSTRSWLRPRRTLRSPGNG